jgi:hypothetical protein
MNSMFNWASAFNQYIGYTSGNQWNTSLVSDMSGMFQNATLFNNGEGSGGTTAPLHWLTPNVTLPVTNFSGPALTSANAVNNTDHPIG